MRRTPPPHSFPALQMSDFSSFRLDARILSAISRMGYVEPTPIQQQAIPVVLAGADVMGAAQTGTGKTAGFGLPLLERILPKANTSMSPARHPVRALVLTPTRELADQVGENLKAYAADTPLRVAVVYGGVDIKPQAATLRGGVEVLTATPGRLLDHVEQKSVNLSQVEIVVLDEADRMLDMGFLPDISRILKLLPAKRQSLLFSATFSPEIKKLAQNFLRDNPVLIEVARDNQTAETVTQEVYKVDSKHKADALIELLKTKGKEGGALEQAIVFVNKKETCRRLARMLQQYDVKADAIHGDKTQDERQAALTAFKEGGVNVLVATDVAARGLDIKELPYVVNFDVPGNPEDYVHRIGRTGRAGAQGLAMMIVTEEDARSLEAIEKLTRQKFDVQALAPKRARRNERPDRRRRDEERVDTPEDERAAKQLARAYTPPAHRSFDPIFTHAYVPSRPKKSAGKAAPFDPYRKKRERTVAVLLGGRPWAREDGRD